jgi:hypothetical protein
MTPPLCLECHEQPVKRSYEKGPKRLQDGIAWRSYCSKACAARTVGMLYGGGNAAAADALHRSNYAAYRDRVRQQLRDEAVAILKAPLADVMKALWRRDQTGYRRGYASAWAQKRKKVSA